MASRSLGTLTLDIVAKIGGFVSGMDKSERAIGGVSAASKKAAKEIDDYIKKMQLQVQINGLSERQASLYTLAMKGATKEQLLAADAAIKLNEAYKDGVKLGEDIRKTVLAAGAALVGLSIGAVLGANKIAEQIAGYQDLAEKAGDTAEAIASLQQASTVSGVGLDAVVAASVKLTASLSKTDDESKSVGQAIKALGLEFDAFKALSPVEQIDAIAKALDGFQDGSEKTAIAVALLGKSGADILPFLNDLADGSERQIRLTADQIKAADDYTKATARLKAEFEGFLQQQTAALIPTLSQVQSLLAEVAKNETVVQSVTGLLTTAIAGAVVVLQTLLVVGSDVAFVFVSVGREIGAVAAQMAALARLDIKGFSAIGDAVKEDGKAARAELDAFQKRVMEIGTTTAAATSTVAATKPKLNISGLAKPAGGSKDDPTKKLLDNQLKELESYISAEKDLMSSRQKFLDLFNSQGIVSVQDYYDQQRAILEEATQNQVKAYDQQIEALRKYQASSSKATDRADAEGKINELIAKQAKLQRDSGASAIEMGIKQEQAIKAYRAQLDEVNAKILELNGSLGAAAAIRFDASNKQLRALAEASGDIASVEQIDRLRAYSVAQADINKLQQDFSLIQGDLQIAEERITIARERGTMGEIESLKASGEARKSAVALLERQLAAYESINAALRTPEQTQAIERLKVQLEGLQATVDPLADRFNTLFENSLGNAFGDFINGTKSAKDAFKDFASSVTNEIGQLVGKQLAKQLFNSIFESSGSSGGASGFNIGGFFASIFGGGRAAGGPVLPNTLYRVNERGPEMFEAANGNQFLMTGSTGGRVHPNGSGGGLTQNISFPVQGRVDRRTVDQAAAELRRQTNAAAVRFG
jgi:hypothetical protein